MDERDPYPDGMLDDALEVGAVTDRSVRAWVRHEGTDPVTLRLEVAGHAPVTARLALGPETDWTGAVTLSLEEPAPGARFTIAHGDVTRAGRLAPAPGEHAAFTFAFASCHHPFGLDAEGRIRKRGATRIYPALREELRARDARFLLLIGDQIYAEAVGPFGVRADLRDDAPPPPAAELVARYRRITRGYFGETGFRALREALPTLCMWDDHDIFDNWGSQREESPLDQALFRAAGRVFSEYQFARDMEGHAPEPPFDVFYRYGTAGVLLLDIRGARSYEEGRLLGATQWRRLQEFLAGETAAELHTLFVVTSVPVAHAARWFTLLGAFAPGDYGGAVRDRWSSNAFIASRDEFLDELFRWQDGAPYRQAILLGGDIHEAESSRIFRRSGGRPIAQFTSSAMSSPHGGMTWLVQHIATQAPNLFERRFRFERDFLCPANNAGLVRLEPHPDGGHRVTFTVRAWDPVRRHLFDQGIAHADARAPQKTTG